MGKVQEVVDKKWPSIYQPAPSAELTWRSFISDPFPLKWPAEPNDVFIVYATARAVDIRHITAGELIGPTWAKITLSPASEPQLDVLTTELTVVERRGPRPLTQDEIQILDLNPLDLLQQKMTPELESKIKAYYRLQQSLGNTPQGIEDKHADFFTWLNQV